MVAYYPNVPVAHAKEIVSGMWCEFTRDQSLDSVPQVWHDMFDRLLDLTTEMPVVCQFLDSYYQQIRGLAMGMHCSPDIANLFGAFYEELQIPNMK